MEPTKPTKRGVEKEDEDEFNRDGDWHTHFFFPGDEQALEHHDEDGDIGWRTNNKNVGRRTQFSYQAQSACPWWADPDPFMP